MAENCNVCPTPINELFGLIWVCVTVIVPEVIALPTLSVTVTVDVPAPTAVSKPVALTVAVAGLDELQV